MSQASWLWFQKDLADYLKIETDLWKISWQGLYFTGKIISPIKRQQQRKTKRDLRTIENKGGENIRVQCFLRFFAFGFEFTNVWAGLREWTKIFSSYWPQNTEPLVQFKIVRISWRCNCLTQCGLSLKLRSVMYYWFRVYSTERLLARM